MGRHDLLTSQRGLSLVGTMAALIVMVIGLAGGQAAYQSYVV